MKLNKKVLVLPGKYYQESLLKRIVNTPFEDSKGKGFYFTMLKMPYFMVAYVIGIPCAIIIDSIFVLCKGDN